MSELTKKHIIDLQIIDDGTMDTVVYDSVNKKTYRYDSDFRFSFKDDTEFLKEIEEGILQMALWIHRD
tara:strand:+ start:776 stop:979 length:204 start_codon:yes stop_codon:yes gene_type:complete